MSVIIPVICGIALELPKSFPSNQLKILTKEEDCQVTLSRRQVACLVAHMFFCTIRPCSDMMRQVTYFDVLRFVRGDLFIFQSNHFVLLQVCAMLRQDVMDC